MSYTLDEIASMVTQVEINPPAPDTVEISVQGETVLELGLASCIFIGTPLPDIIESRDQAVATIQAEGDTQVGRVDSTADAGIATMTTLQNQAAASANNAATSANQASTSAGSAATSATASANSASASASSATQASNHVASAQGIVNALGDTQYALSQIGLGFAGLVDGDLIVNYADPITDVTMSNGEISITF
jgi:hypothetical protein